MFSTAALATSSAAVRSPCRWSPLEDSDSIFFVLDHLKLSHIPSSFCYVSHKTSCATARWGDVAWSTPLDTLHRPRGQPQCGRLPISTPRSNTCVFSEMARSRR